MPRNNWTPVVLDLLYLLTEEGGASLDYVDIGWHTTHLKAPKTSAERLEIRHQAASAITAVDASTMRIILDGELAVLSIVLGNEPDEIVQDCTFGTVGNHSKLYWMLKTITSKFSRQWEDKPCPVIEGEEPEPISDDAYRAAAVKKHHSDGRVEVDWDAEVFVSEDDGAYVAARVWVYNDDVTAEDRA
jgi:hypothetical protein